MMLDQLEQLKELLEMQKVLDESIFKAKDITEYPLENMKVALYVELGELMNEFPTKFKHWKSSAVDDREKGLVEYVDCLHFALSLFNESGFSIWRMYEYENINVRDSIATVLKLIVTQGLDDSLYWLLVLGKLLNFTWEEIYTTYKKKNEINYKRLKEGY